MATQAFQTKDTKHAKTSMVANVYARVYSIEGSVKIEFVSGEVEAGAWLTPTQANELIQLLQATFIE